MSRAAAVAGSSQRETRGSTVMSAVAATTTTQPPAGDGVNTTSVSTAPSSLLCPQTTTRDYNRFLVQTLEASDGERRELLRQVDQVATSMDALGDVRGDLQRRTSDLHETQRTVTEQELALQEERERSARLMAENHALMAEQDDARAKIAALLQMRLTEAALHPTAAASPVMVQIPTKQQRGGAAASGGRAPDTSEASGLTEPSHIGRPAAGNTASPPVAAALSLRSVVEASSRSAIPPVPVRGGGAAGARSAGERSGTTATGSDPSGHTEPHGAPAATTAAESVESVLKHQPPGSTLVAALSEEVKTLQQLLDEQRAAYERDRGMRIADARRVEQDLHRDMKKMNTTIDDQARRLHQAVSDLCVYRHEMQVTERKLRGEIEILTARAAEAERLLSVERAHRAADVQTALESQTAKTSHVVDRVRVRLSETEERARRAAELYEERIRELEGQVTAARDEAAREKRIRVRCEQRLTAEQEGRQSDVGLLRQQLRTLEKRIFFNTLHADDVAIDAVGAVAAHAALSSGVDVVGAMDAEDRNDAEEDAVWRPAADASPQRDDGHQQPMHAPTRRAAPSGVARAAQRLAEVETDDNACVIHGLGPHAARLRQVSPSRVVATDVPRRTHTQSPDGASPEEQAAAKRRAARILADLMGTRAFSKEL